MKRNKIKPKYLNIIKPNNQKESIIDRIEHKTIKIAITIGLILLMSIWTYIPMIFLPMLHLSYENFTMTQKIIYLIIADVLFLIFLIYLYRFDIKKNFNDYFKKNFLNNFKHSSLYWIIGLGIMFISNYIIYFLTDGALTTNEENVRSLIDLAPWYMVFELIIYAPITEELIFRKSIKETCQHKYLYIFLSGFIFGGLHVFPSLKEFTDLLFLIPYCTLGFFFAALYQKTNNIFSTITAHALHNTLALILYII